MRTRVRFLKHLVFRSANKLEASRIMAKKSMVLRETRRLKIVQRYAKKRAELKKTIQSPATGDEQRADALRRLQTMPRDASPSRLQAMAGHIPGLSKASW